MASSMKDITSSLYDLSDGEAIELREVVIDRPLDRPVEIPRGIKGTGVKEVRTAISDGAHMIEGAIADRLEDQIKEQITKSFQDPKDIDDSFKSLAKNPTTAKIVYYLKKIKSTPLFPFYYLAVFLLLHPSNQILGKINEIRNGHNKWNNILQLGLIASCVGLSIPFTHWYPGFGNVVNNSVNFFWDTLLGLMNITVPESLIQVTFYPFTLSLGSYCGIYGGKVLSSIFTFLKSGCNTTNPEYFVDENEKRLIANRLLMKYSLMENRTWTINDSLDYVNESIAMILGSIHALNMKYVDVSYLSIDIKGLEKILRSFRNGDDSDYVKWKEVQQSKLTSMLEMMSKIKNISSEIPDINKLIELAKSKPKIGSARDVEGGDSFSSYMFGSDEDDSDIEPSPELKEDIKKLNEILKNEFNLNPDELEKVAKEVKNRRVLNSLIEETTKHNLKKQYFFSRTSKNLKLDYQPAEKELEDMNEQLEREINALEKGAKLFG